MPGCYVRALHKPTPRPPDPYDDNSGTSERNTPIRTQPDVLGHLSRAVGTSPRYTPIHDQLMTTDDIMTIRIISYVTGLCATTLSTNSALLFVSSDIGATPLLIIIDCATYYRS